jgi:hypothetical protein
MSTIKSQRALDVLERYIRPRMRRGVDFNARPLFYGIDDNNVARKLDDIIGGAIRLTTGDLALDANAPELKREMRKAIGESDRTIVAKSSSTKRAPQNNPQEPAPDFEESKIEQVLELLQHRLLPGELAAVREMLLKPSRKSQARHPDGTEAIKEDYAEDAAARVAFEKRFPSAMRIVVEPTARPETPRHASPAMDERSVSDFFKRFPGAARIGQAL